MTSFHTVQSEYRYRMIAVSHVITHLGNDKELTLRLEKMMSVFTLKLVLLNYESSALPILTGKHVKGL